MPPYATSVMVVNFWVDSWIEFCVFCSSWDLFFTTWNCSNHWFCWFNCDVAFLHLTWKFLWIKCVFFLGGEGEKVAFGKKSMIHKKGLSWIDWSSPKRLLHRRFFLGKLPARGATPRFSGDEGPLSVEQTIRLFTIRNDHFFRRHHLSITMVPWVIPPRPPISHQNCCHALGLLSRLSHGFYAKLYRKKTVVKKLQACVGKECHR